MRNPLTIIAVLASLAILAGCYEYQAQVELKDDGAGSRTVWLESEQPLEPELLHLLALDGPGWKRENVSTGDDNRLRYRRKQTIDGFDGWAEAGGVLMRGRAEGDVRLVSTIEVEKVLSSGNLRYIYRETLHWIGLREELAAHIGEDYAAMLGREFPGLPPGLVERCRGIMMAGMVLRWNDLVEAEGHEDAGDALAEEIIALVGDQLRREGQAPELVDAVAEATRDWDPLTGVEEALPGVDACTQSSLVLAVTMPGRVLDGNAESIEDKLAVFRIDLLQTLGRPVVLEVECGR